MQENTDIQAKLEVTSGMDAAALAAAFKEAQDTLAKVQAAHKGEVDGLEHRIKELEAQVAYLQRQLFGRKSEKLRAVDPNWPGLFDDEFADLQKQADEKRDEAVEKLEKEQPKEDRKQKRRNRIMMENLPVLKTTVINPEGIDLTLYKKMGEEVTRVVEFEPGKLYIHEIIRPKYGLKDNTQLPPKGQRSVMVAEMPLLPINKGIPAASLLTEILLQKYEYHVPFYRQISQFMHLGMKGLKENTIDGWFKKTAELLRPLYGVLEREVMRSAYLQADETTNPVIDEEKHKAAKEYLWMVRAVTERLVLFHYDKGSRAGAVIESLAKKHDFKGYMQCDGFAGYETAFKANPGVTLVNCMVHIRRHFEQAMGENKAAAEHALAQIQHLYKIERLCDEAGLSHDERKAKRQELARPIMEAFKAWIESDGMKYSQTSEMGKAITYAYTRWDNMMHYLDDGRIHLDNNLAENEIRPRTLGRKNFLFCGNHEAAENMCVICSLLSTCKNHNVNPRLYLQYIIARMPYVKKDATEQLLEMLPHKWIAQHPEAVIPKLRDEA